MGKGSYKDAANWREFVTAIDVEAEASAIALNKLQLLSRPGRAWTNPRPYWTWIVVLSPMLAEESPIISFTGSGSTRKAWVFTSQ